MLTVGSAFREARAQGVPFQLDLSNDGTLLVYASTEAVQVLRTEDGSVVHTHHEPRTSGFRGAGFVNGGDDVVFLVQAEDGLSGELKRIPARGGDAEVIASYPFDTRAHSIARSRDGRAFAVLGIMAEIWMDGQVLRTLPGASASRWIQATFSPDGERIYVHGTVEKAVVCYDILSGEERGRWEAASDYGDQVLVTPDERFLVSTAGSSVAIHDMVWGERIWHDADGFRTFGRGISVWEAWVTVPDSSLLASLKSSLYTFQLPMLEDTTIRRSIVEVGTRVNSGAWAWDAPLTAFGTREGQLLWVPLVPTETPPVRVDNVTFDDDTDFEALVAQVLRGEGGYGSFPRDTHPLDWIDRAYTQVGSTPYAARLAHGVARCLTAPEPLVRAQAVLFFQTHKEAACGNRIGTLLAGDRALFAGVPDPLHPGTDLEWQLLTALSARITGYDRRALELGMAEVLKPGKAEPLIGALCTRDPDWVVENAERIVSGTPKAGATLLIQLAGGGHDMLELARRVAPLCKSDPRFVDDINRFVDDPGIRQAILVAHDMPALPQSQVRPEPEPDELGLLPDVRKSAEEAARDLILGGFHTRDEVADRIFVVSGPQEKQVSLEQARAIVDTLWAARGAEQADWPEVTDADRVLSVFDTLTANGITARANFTCCNSCGFTEIRGEATEDARGFVFFHQQDVRGATGGSLLLSYGSLDNEVDPTSVGQEVVEALTAAGLPVEWDGSARSRIAVTPLDWKKRLPAG